MEYKIDCKSVGQRIKARKMALQITVYDLYLKSGIPEDTINNIVYGRTADPRIETLAKIAMALDTTLDYIVFGTQTSAQIDDTPRKDPTHSSNIDDHIRNLKEHHEKEIASILESHERYIRDMKEAHEREVIAVRDYAGEIRRIRNFWRALACGLATIIFVILAWFVLYHQLIGQCA